MAVAGRKALPIEDFIRFRSEPEPQDVPITDIAKLFGAPIEVRKPKKRKT